MGLFGQTVLAVRAQHVRAADPLPVYEQALLGGDATLRGFKLGYRSGDRLLAGSAEIRVPLSTPRRFTRHGPGRSSPIPGRSTVLANRWTAPRGTPASAPASSCRAPLLGLRVDVARGLGSGTRVHFTLGTTF